MTAPSSESAETIFVHRIKISEFFPYNFAIVRIHLKSAKQIVEPISLNEK